VSGTKLLEGEPRWPMPIAAVKQWPGKTGLDERQPVEVISTVTLISAALSGSRLTGTRDSLGPQF